MAQSSNNQEYTWTVGDVRALDERLTKMDSKLDSIQDELAVKNHIVVDNTTRTDWKAIGVVAVSIIGALGTLYLTIRGGL